MISFYENVLTVVLSDVNLHGGERGKGISRVDAHLLAVLCTHDIYIKLLLKLGANEEQQIWAAFCKRFEKFLKEGDWLWWFLDWVDVIYSDLGCWNL